MKNPLTPSVDRAIINYTQAAQIAEEDQQVFQQAGGRRLHHHTPKHVQVGVTALPSHLGVRTVLQDAVRVDDELGEWRMSCCSPRHRADPSDPRGVC